MKANRIAISITLSFLRLKRWFSELSNSIVVEICKIIPITHAVISIWCSIRRGVWFINRFPIGVIVEKRISVDHLILTGIFVSSIIKHKIIPMGILWTMIPYVNSIWFDKGIPSTNACILKLNHKVNGKIPDPLGW